MADNALTREQRLKIRVSLQNEFGRVAKSAKFDSKVTPVYGGVKVTYTVPELSPGSGEIKVVFRYAGGSFIEIENKSQKLLLLSGNDRDFYPIKDVMNSIIAAYGGKIVE